jgi:hypothetical protein
LVTTSSSGEDEGSTGSASDYKDEDDDCVVADALIILKTR